MRFFEFNVFDETIIRPFKSFYYYYYDDDTLCFVYRRNNLVFARESLGNISLLLDYVDSGYGREIFLSEAVFIEELNLVMNDKVKMR